MEKITLKDYKEDKVSEEDFLILVDNFKNYLNFIDETNKITEKDGEKDWTLEKLNKIEKNIIKNCKMILSGEVMAIDSKGKMSSYSSTEKIIFNLIREVNDLIIIRNKIKELSNN